MFPAFSVFPPHLALCRFISLYLLQLNLTRFLFTSLFAVSFHTCDAPFMRFGWGHRALDMEGHQWNVVSKNCETVFRFFNPAPLVVPFVVPFVLSWRSPHILLPLRSWFWFSSSFGFSLAFVSSQTVEIKWSQAQQQKEMGVGVRYWTRFTRYSRAFTRQIFFASYQARHSPLLKLRGQGLRDHPQRLREHLHVTSILSVVGRFDCQFSCQFKGHT